MSQKSLMRPFANMLTQNEYINIILAFALKKKARWQAKDIFAIAKALDVFPMSDDYTYTYRILKNLATKEILSREQIWQDSPTVYYLLGPKGNVHFYTGERAVVKVFERSHVQLTGFISEFEKRVDGNVTAATDLSDQTESVIGVADYYQWLLLHAARNGQNPSAFRNQASELGKEINLTHVYKIRRELVDDGLVADNWITAKGETRLLVLERELLGEIGLAKRMIEKMKGIEQGVDLIHSSL